MSEIAAAANAETPATRGRALRGAVWTVGGFGFSQVLRLGGNIVLARLLAPELFGVMALVNVFIQGLNMFSDMGLRPAIIQRREGATPAFLNTAWTVQVLRGVGLTIAAGLLAWPLAQIYDPQLLTVLPVAALAALISGFNSTSLAMLHRRLEMGKVMLIETGSQTISTIAAVGLALWFESVWVLVAGNLAGALTRMAASHVFVEVTRNRFAWDRQAWRTLFEFGKWIFVSSAIAFVAGQADRLILGVAVPLELLGVYSFAVMLSRLPYDASVRVCGSVLFPALANSGHRGPEQLRSAFTQARAAVLPVSLLATLAVAAGGPLFFELLYEEEYHAAGWMAQLLSVSVWFGLLQASADRALLAAGDSRSLAISSGAKAAVTVGASIGGYWLAGVPGFIVGVAVGAWAGHLCIQIGLARRQMPIWRADVAYTVAFAACACLGAARELGLLAAQPDQTATIIGLSLKAGVLLAATIWTALRTWRLLRP